MLWARYDVDSQDDAASNLLRREFGEGAWERFLRFIEIAKRTNRQGMVLLASGKPCRAIHLAAVHAPWLPIDVELANWNRHIGICLELGLLAQSEDEVLRVVDWKRWHISPSEEPEQVAERKRKSRDKTESRNVTDSHEMSRTVTDVTTHSIAEQSKPEQNKTEQTSKQEEVRVRPTAGQPFLSLCEQSYEAFHPGAGPISSNMLSKAMDFHDRNRGQPSYKGLLVNESDICAAWTKGIDGTKKALRGDNPPRVPWNYCATIAQQELSTVVERRFEIEAIKRNGERK